MRFERERDIPAFCGADWRQRAALRRRARERDRSIIWLSGLYGGLTALFLPLSRWLVQFLIGRVELLPWIALYCVFGFLFGYVFYGVVITPRVRRALEMDEKTVPENNRSNS